MGVLAFRVDNLENWNRENPLLEDGEMAIVRDAKHYKIGDGFHRFNELESFGHGMTAYEIAVLHGHFRGSIDDFAAQFNQFSRYGEQQCGKFANNGPGWNTFLFPEEFGEDVYVTTTVEDKAAYASIRNIKKTGFQYCVYDGNGNTTTENVIINYNAVAVSNKNLAHTIAQTAGLNPFDFDNLEMLFISNAAEIVASEAAFGITKRSSMAAAKHICNLVGLDLYQYHNVASAAADEAAMNIIATSSAARGFVQSSAAAYDAFRLSDMAIVKYSVALAGLAPEAFPTLQSLCENTESVTQVVRNKDACEALTGSAIAMATIRGHQITLDAFLSSDVAMTEIAKNKAAVVSFFDDQNALSCLVNNAVAMAAVIKSQNALDHVLNNSVAMAEIVKQTSAVSIFFNNQNALTCLVNNATAMAAVAGSATAMAAIMKNSNAKEKFFGANYSVGRGIATYANISNNTLIGLQSMSAVAASATAMSAVAASAVASGAVASIISNYRSQIVSAISSSSLFSKTTTTVGSGAGTTTHGLNTNTIYIPINCYDDNDTNFTVYSGVNTSVQIAYIAKHSGTPAVTVGVGLRGTQVVGTGSSVGNVGFDIYTKK